MATEAEVPEKKIRVLIVDDASVIRTLLSALLKTDPGIEVVGTAPDPYIAREKLLELKPDVMTLDIEMPKMDGITFLEKVMEHFPTRTIIISNLTVRGSEMALKALEYGAIDVIAKPKVDVTKTMTEMAADIIARVRAAASARVVRKSGDRERRVSTVAKKPLSSLPRRPATQILAIAASTGGTQALKQLLTSLPEDIPGTLVVQHMPAAFMKTFAKSLNDSCPFEVREAVDGDRITPGVVLLAPGDFHMEIYKAGTGFAVKLHQSPQLHGVRPSADYLMKSIAKYAGSQSVGVILTGMGRDGAEGLLQMKRAGSYNIAQDEETCVVYGMPKVAVELGATDQVLPLSEIAGKIRERFKL